MEVVADSLLVCLARRGDVTACQELIHRYRDRILAVAKGYVRDREEAQDITQEIFLRMLEGLPNFREEANFYTWLHRIAVNRCIDWGRSRSRRLLPVSLDELIDSEWAEPADQRVALRPDHALMIKELRSQLRSAIAAIPEVHRTAVVLSDVEGYSPTEVAQFLGCPVNTVKTRLHRGRRVARRRLSAYLDGGGKAQE